MAGQTINVSVLADTKQFSSGMKGLKDSLSGLGSSLQTIGGGFKSIGSGLTKYITAPAVGAAAAGAGIVAAFGWKRLVGLDTAQGQLKGLGYQGKDLTQIMDGVGKGVTDTTLSLADGTSLMVGALATGNLELKDTESYVRRVANVSAAYGVDSAHAGRLLNNVLVKNKVTWGDLAQMQENNIPIVTALADHYGVAGDEIEKMASEGKISIEDLNNVLDKNAGAAAEEYSKTWAGVTANIKSNIGKIGAAVLGTSFEQIKDQAQTFLDLLRSPGWMEFATTLGEQIGSALSTIIEKVTELIAWWQGLDDGTKGIILSLVGFAIAAGPVLMAIGSIISSIGGAILWLQQMHQAFVVLKGVMSAVALGPILLIIAGIAALVAALVWFFTQTETGQQMWAVAWAAIKDAAAAVADWFVNVAWPAMLAAWEGIKAAAQVVADWMVNVAWPAIQSAWQGIQDAASAAADWFMTYVSPVISAAIDLVVAIFERLQQAWGVAWGAIQAVWATIGPPLMAAISNAITVLSAIWSVIWTNMKVVLEAVWNIMKTAVQTALRVMESVIKAITAAIRGDWGAAWGHIKDALSRAWEGMKSIASTATTALKTTVTNAMNAIKSGMDTVWSKIKTAVSEAWNKVKSTTTEKINEVVAFVKEMPGKIVSALGDLSTLLTGAAKQVIDGFIDGLTAGFTRVKNKLGDLTSLLPSWKGHKERDRNILKDSGHLVIDGFIEGLEDRYAKVKRSLKGLTKDVADTAFDSPTAPVVAPVVRDARFARSARGEATTDTGSGTTEIHVHLEVEDLAAIRTVEDFISMIDVRRRMAVGAT